MLTRHMPFASLQIAGLVLRLLLAFAVYQYANWQMFFSFLPWMLSDAVLGTLIYSLSREAEEHDTGRNALWISGLYLLNPVSISSSAIWWRLDAAFVVLLFTSVLLLTNEGLGERIRTKGALASFVLYAVVVSIWPMALAVAPVFAYSMARTYVQASAGTREFGIIGPVAVATAALGILVLLRTAYPQAFVVLAYISAGEHSPAYGSLVGMLGNITSISYIGVTVSAVLALVMLWRNFSGASIMYVSAFVATAIYVFSFPIYTIGMFAHPSLPPSLFLIAPLLALSLASRPSAGIAAIALSFALSGGLSLANTLVVHNLGTPLPHSDIWLPLVNFALFLIIASAHFHIFKKIRPEPQLGRYAIEHTPQTPVAKRRKRRALAHLASRIDDAISRREVLAISLLTIVYAIIAFVRLGDTQAPQSFWDQRTWREEVGYAAEQQVAWIDMGQDVAVSEIMAYLGPREAQSFALFASFDNLDWAHVDTFEMYAVFSWHRLELEVEGRFFQIIPTSTNLMLGELEFRNSEGVRLEPTASYNAQNLFDEAHIVPPYPSFMNGTYFDEIYHPRTAFEFIHGLYVYEDTHPPLGKTLISLGIRMFGMTPFGWRFVGTLFGVAMVPLMYLLAREVFEKRATAFVAAGLFTFDFMHFTQTRLATIDTYVTFFVILMYYFMYKFYSSDFTKTSFAKDCVWLGLSGLFMGLAIASKWQGVYAAAGLAVLWLVAMVHRHNDYTWLSASVNSKYSASPTESKRVLTYPADFGNILCMCVVLFIALPAAVYILSYADYVSTPGKAGISSIIDNQVRMFNYHAFLDEGHPFASPWWEWPLNVRPLFAYQRWPDPYTAAGISSFGNPLVWWGGLVGIVYVFGSIFDKTKNRKVPAFIFISFAAQYFPWALIGRTTFIYHYFPSTPFIALALTYLVSQTIDEDIPQAKYAILLTAIALFVAFYPVLSGLPVPASYIETFLRWFQTWQLI